MKVAVMGYYARYGTVAFKKAYYIIGHCTGHGNAGIHGLGSYMRCKNHVVHFQQFGKRIISELKNIQSGSTYDSFLQSLHQSMLVNQRASACID
jgi:hypothetical protein